MAGELRAPFEMLLTRIHGEVRRPTGIQEGTGAQGASSSRIRYFRVSSEGPSGARTDDLVAKDAPLLERRVLTLLSEQGCAVPPVQIAEAGADGRGTVIMPHTDAQPAGAFARYLHPFTRSAARALSGIHAANLGERPGWLPAASEHYEERLWLYPRRALWESALQDNDFAAEFGAYTDGLESSAAQFMQMLETLEQEGDTLTLLNVDLLPDHLRQWRGEAVIIDWEQARYASFYLDLPNAFSVETVLAYRDALAEHGHEVPVMEFLERYREVGRFMGLRWLSAALEDWHAGGARRAERRWWLYYTLTLALRGR